MADDLERYLSRLPDALLERLSSVVREEAERLSEAQRERLRSLQQDPEETGNLEESCTVTEGAHPLEYIVQAGGGLTTVDGFDHALAFEFGTAHQPARSFFYSTYNEMRSEIEANISEAIEEELSK